MTNLNKALLLLLILGISWQNATAQKIKSPDDILIGNDSLPKVFLLGTFHFSYPNHDTHKTDKSRQIDILSDQKQKELKKLLDYIAKFHPTKIAIEAGAKWEAMAKYRLYKERKIKPQPDERYQIAFWLMDKFKLDTIYTVDAGNMAIDLSAAANSSSFMPYIDSLFNDYNFTTNKRYDAYYDYLDSLSVKIPLLEYYTYINSQKALQRNYGGYLLGDFKLGDYRGADAMAAKWYDRNLRIFRNIQRITTSPGDRVLILYGFAHVAVLDNLFNCSSEYQYIKFGDLK